MPRLPEGSLRPGHEEQQDIERLKGVIEDYSSTNGQNFEGEAIRQRPVVPPPIGACPRCFSLIFQCIRKVTDRTFLFKCAKGLSPYRGEVYPSGGGEWN
jgi:hypothetical protein